MLIDKYWCMKISLVTATTFLWKKQIENDQYTLHSALLIKIQYNFQLLLLVQEKYLPISPAPNLLACNVDNMDHSREGCLQEEQLKRHDQYLLKKIFSV